MVGGRKIKKSNYKKAMQVFLSLLVLFVVSFFFYREFQKNWEIVRSYDLKINLLYIVLSFSAIVVTYLLTTYGWFFTLNFLSNHKITFPESVAMVNTSNLTKYIPGKVWSYALQMYWLAKLGFSKSLVLYVNLVNLYVSLMTALIVGLGYLVLSPDVFPLSMTVPLLSILVLFEFCFIKFNSTIINRLLAAFNAVFKRDIQYFEITVNMLLYLHGIYVVAAFSFGMGAYLLCFGIGFEVATNRILQVMSSLMISEVAGFIAVITPGGLGVREGVMYLLLKGVSPGALSFILPLAMRLVSMIADIFFGTAGLVLFKQFNEKAASENRSMAK